MKRRVDKLDELRDDIADEEFLYSDIKCVLWLYPLQPSFEHCFKYIYLSMSVMGCPIFNLMDLFVDVIACSVTLIISVYVYQNYPTHVYVISLRMMSSSSFVPPPH